MLAIRMINPSGARGLIEYLTEQVATAAGHGVSPMTRYFKAAGQPPGRWLGAGLAGMAMVADWTVSGAALERLFQEGTHPRSGTALTAHSYTVAESLADRVAMEMAKLPDGLSADERAAAEAAVVADQKTRRQRASVSGFELVFAPPKSFSVAWGLADVAVKEQLSAAHDAALAETIQIMEDRYLRTRVGTNGVAQVSTRGAVAARFDHWNSRALDPHLHTHVLVANRVQGPDGRWRTIDSRGALMPAAVTLSETYTSLLMDRVTERLGWTWENTSPQARRQSGWGGPLPADAPGADPIDWVADKDDDDDERPRRPIGLGKTTKWEISGVPAELIAEFSQRSASLQDAVDSAIAAFEHTRGRPPRASELLRLRERARRDTAPDKQVLSLEQLTETWTRRAKARGPGVSWLAGLVGHGRQEVASAPRAIGRGDDVHPKRIEWAVNGALQQLALRSTWRRHNAAAEAHRLLRDVRFQTAKDRLMAVDLVVDEVIARAVPLSPPARLPSPVQFRTPDGRSAFDPAGDAVFTTEELIDAEQSILAAAQTDKACPIALVDATRLQKAGLDSGQAAAVLAIAASKRRIDVLVGPAGTGKTTTLRQLRSAWERQHGAGSVVGLAPSAAAAAVLGEALEIPTENTAKWLFENARGTKGWKLRAGQLVIVDEASLAGTLAIDRLRELATHAGAKLLLVGDPHQVAAVDAGGALELLITELGDAAPTLTQVWRFRNEWEAAASLRLRVGRVDVLDEYDAQGRLHDGDRQQMLDGALQAWQDDEAADLTSILVVDEVDTMNDLNARAQAHRVDVGLVDLHAAADVSGGMRAGRGDRVLTRLNERYLQTAHGAFVKNGQAWTVAEVFADGALALVDEYGDSVVVPAGYAASSVDLGYAITAHRAQGATVDTSHVLVTDRSVRENIYVGMTRGRLGNHAWTITGADAGDDPTWEAEATAREVLERALARRGADQSATTTKSALHDAAESIRQLAAEYETISAAAGTTLWEQRMHQIGLDPQLVSQLIGSTAWPSTVALLRRADALGLDAIAQVPELIAERGLADADEPASVLHYRVGRWISTAAGHGEIPRIVGLIPRTPTTDLPADVVDALDAREAAMIDRAEALVDAAAADSWLAHLGGLTDEQREFAHTIAAYRDRHGVDVHDSRPLGGAIPSGSTARSEWALANAAWKRLSEAASSRSVARVEHVDSAPAEHIDRHEY